MSDKDNNKIDEILFNIQPIATEEQREALRGILKNFMPLVSRTINSSENAGKFREALDSILGESGPIYREITGDLLPYIEKELQKPEYNGATLQSLLNEYEIKDLAHLPEDSTLLKVIEAARVAKAKQKTYRTKKKAKEAGAITETPDNLALITLAGFENSLSFHESGAASLQALQKQDAQLTFKDGELYLTNDANEISKVELQDITTKESIETLNTPLLAAFYSILLEQWSQQVENSGRPADVISLSVPAFSKFIGKKANQGTDSAKDLIDKVKSFHNIVGVFKDGTTNRQSIFPVLLFEGYDAKTNTISFSSPYMRYLINMIYLQSIRRDKNGKTLTRKDGQPKLKPAYSYLVHADLLKEKNTAAIENVYIIIRTIEQAGDHTPHISARTILERNPQFYQRLEQSSNKNQLLKRVFIKTWQLLREKTSLQDRYKGIKLPEPRNPKNIPTMSTLDNTFEFPHQGKKG